MDVTLVLSAVIFTLLAIVVATSLFGGSPSSVDFARSYFGNAGESTAGGFGRLAGARQNGRAAAEKQQQKKTVEDWSDVSVSSHDHWDVVKSVLSEESQSHRDAAGPPAHGHPASGCRPSSSASNYSVSSTWPASRDMSVDLDTFSEASWGSRRSFIGLSEKELLKCAFSYPQTEGAAESPDVGDKAQSNANSSARYAPGMARSNHMQTMMSREELEEEQRVQREQMAAIFQLLKENKETFGEVSEGDMEEQLRLYSI